METTTNERFPTQKRSDVFPYENVTFKDRLGRRQHRHKYADGKPHEEISLKDLQAVIEHGNFTRPRIHKPYVVMTYWVGNRRTEPLGIVKEDVRLEGDSLFIKIPACKGGIRGGAIELPLTWYGVPLIKQRWTEIAKGKRLFPFRTSTAYRIIKRLWPKKTPHHLRYNRVTKMRTLRDQGKIDTDAIKSYTGIQSDATIQHYGMKTQKKIHSVAVVMNE
jgi:hypothetical protein